MEFTDRIRFLSSLPPKQLRDKRALVRIDTNVPLADDGTVDVNADWRLRTVVPTLKRLRQNGVATVLLGHLGRPDGSADPALRLQPVADRLGQIMHGDVRTVPSVLGPDVDQAVQGLSSGAMLMLENIRFHPGEERNSASFAERLAALGDIYLNDAFAVSHRRHASIVGLPRHMPAFGGLLLEQELRALNAVLHDPPRPLVVMMGGAKVGTKAPAVRRLLHFADTVIVGGVLANTVLAERGIDIGSSRREDVELPFDVTASSLLLPTDAVVASSWDAEDGTVVSIDDVAGEDRIVDIGPATQEAISTIIADAGMVVWNGPLGYIENDSFVTGTRAVAGELMKSGAQTIVGGGDTIGVLQRFGMLAGFSHISTGGGAMLAYLASETLPGVEALKMTSV